MQRLFNVNERVEYLDCPLCAAATGVVDYFRGATRRYLRCADCGLVFVHGDDRPTRAEELQRYLEHRNTRDDAGYVQFLRRFIEPLCAAVPTGSRGLDVGCGPVPVLSELLTANGRPTLHYDPLFFPGVEVLQGSYDFVTCSEVVEHAHDPAALFAQLFGLLRPAGTLGVMTSLLDDSIDFATWWYRRDVTHVCFFSAATMEWVGAQYGRSVEIVEGKVVLFADEAGTASRART